VPKPGALQTGEVVRAEELGNTGNGDHKVEKDVAEGVAGGAAVGAGAGAAIEGGTRERSEAEQIVEAHQAVDERQGIQEESENGQRNANDWQVLDGNQEENGTAGIEKGISEVAISEPPTATTAPGPPTGGVVFDHAPTKGEMKEVRESMETRR